MHEFLSYKRIQASDVNCSENNSESKKKKKYGNRRSQKGQNSGA